MKTVKVKNVVLGEGKPKICIPLVDATRKSLADSARRVLAYPCDLIEWRADYYNTKYDPEETAAAIQTLRSILGDFPILYTMRTGREGGMSELTDEEYERTIVTTSAYFANAGLKASLKQTAFDAMTCMSGPP